MSRRVLLALAIAISACSGDDPPPVPSKGRPPEAPAGVVLQLPRDLAAARAAVDLRVVATTFQTMRLTVSNARRGARIELPVGLRFLPPRPGEDAPLALVAPLAVDVAPGAKARSYDLTVVNLDPTIWKDPAADDPAYEIGELLPDGLLERFLVAGTERKMVWALLQTGAWIVDFDVEPDVYVRNKVATTRMFMPETSSASSLADWSGIRRVDRLLAELGAHPERYKLVKANRQELADFVAKIDLERPHLNATSMLVNRVAVEYAGEPEVEAALLRWATEHPETHVRQDAVRNLVEIGLSGDRASLFETMLATPHREVRFLAALGLRRQDDRRGVPVLAALVEQPFFRELLPGWRDELDAWRKAADWDRLEREHGDVRGIRALVDRMAEEGDPVFLDLLARTRGADPEDVARAIDALQRRYATRPEAFEALSHLALEHPERNVRIQAFDALRMSFDRFDALAVARRILAGSTDVEFVRDTIGRVAKTHLAGREEFLVEATGHADARVRAGAIREVGPDQLAKALPEERRLELVAKWSRDDEAAVRRAALALLGRGRSAIPEDEAVRLVRERAEGDPDEGLRWEATTMLHQRRSPEYLPIARRWLESGTPGRKRMVVSDLVDWEGDAGALDVLEAFRADPVVGRGVAPHLKRYGR